VRNRAPILPPLPRPITDTPPARALCEELVPGAAPLLLEINAPPAAVPNQCTQNVAAVVEACGGSIEYGWKLYESLPSVLLEAEFHAVWVDDDGDRHDVTPSEIPLITHTAFLADPSLAYDGRQINNVRVALQDDPLIDEYIEICEDAFEVMNRGKLATYHGPVVETPEMRAIDDRLEAVGFQIVEKYYA
jgi:hypothetical protein